jgi:chromosome segregation ATPase
MRSGAPASEAAESRPLTEHEQGGLRARGEEALGDLAQALMDNPLFGQALTTALGAGERAAQAQRSAMGALNIPAASDLERMEQRIRSLSNRLEAVEDQLDEALDTLAAFGRRMRERDSEPATSVPGSEPDE